MNNIRRWLYRNRWFNFGVHFVRGLKRQVRWLGLSATERQRDTVTLSTLANHRFGNQFFQYIFLRTYAEDRGLRYETSPWVGEKLFGTRVPHLSRKLPEFRVKADDMGLSSEPRNVDFRGYFQFHTSTFAAHKEQIRSWCQPVGEFAEKSHEAMKKLKARGTTLVGLHLRRGDFGYGYFFIAPNSWYKNWLASFWSDLENPVLYIASDLPEYVRSDFSGYDPVTAGDLGITLPPGFDYYLDYYLLTQCHHLAISNSTFSVVAAMLNEKAVTTVRPVLQEQRLVPFDPWSTYPMLRDAVVKDYPDVWGTTWDDYDYPGRPGGE